MSLETPQRHILVLIAPRSRCHIPSTSLRNTLIANARFTVSVNSFSLKAALPCALAVLRSCRSSPRGCVNNVGARGWRKY